MLFAFSVAPLGAGESVTDSVAEAVRIVRESGLPNRTDSMFTTIEGEWDECMDVIKRATEAVGAGGHRVSLVVKADIRPGHTGEARRQGRACRGTARGLDGQRDRQHGQRDAVRPRVTWTSAAQVWSCSTHEGPATLLP